MAESETGEPRRLPLRMEYRHTRLVDFNYILAHQTTSLEVRSTGLGEYGLYVHKPLRNQGRFGSGRAV
ncbi:MAG: hypothetical protein AABX17_03385 [Nanoarchaeota archaeon]